jgi:hypothetical protein
VWLSGFLACNYRDFQPPATLRNKACATEVEHRNEDDDMFRGALPWLIRIPLPIIIILLLLGCLS